MDARPGPGSTPGPQRTITQGVFDACPQELARRGRGRGRSAPDDQARWAAGLVARLRRALLTGVLAGILVATVASARAEAAAGGPYAIHSMLQLSSPYVFKQEMFAEAAAAGASEIRVDVSLGALNNPWISQAMWQGVDDYMQLSQEYALPVLIDLNASNDISLETCQAGGDPTTGLCGVSNLSGYYSEVAALVRHTAGVINDFEVVNEPDGAWAFTGTPQQYAGMLATGYQAVHDNNPAGRVLLGGIMSPSDWSWLNSVFLTPGFDAAHKFDIANVHLRDTLAKLPGEVLAWRSFFTFWGDGSLPLWVTETGYPADPAYQYDPGYKGTDAASGQAEQAAFLAHSLPTLLYAGAARVFVTERDDNLWGEYSSEGLLGGQVTDADESAPDPIPKPAYAVFQSLAANAPSGPPPALWIAPPAPPPAPPAPPAPPPPARPAMTKMVIQAHPAAAARRRARAARRRRPARPHPRRRPARIAHHGRTGGERRAGAGARGGPVRGRRA